MGSKVDQLKNYVAERGVIPPWLRKGGGFDRIVGFQVRFVKTDKGIAFVTEPSKYGGSNPTPSKWYKIVEVPVFMPVNIVFDGVKSEEVDLKRWSRQINRSLDLGISGWLASQLVEDRTVAPPVQARDLSAPVGTEPNPVLLDGGNPAAGL